MGVNSFTGFFGLMSHHQINAHLVCTGRIKPGTECVSAFMRCISDNRENPFDTELRKMGIKHILIPPRTPWHNGKVERSHRNDQRYFYDWETFRTTEELNQKLQEHLNWSNNKTMRTLGRKSPMQLLKEKLAV